jgi:hypothetical protein
MAHFAKINQDNEVLEVIVVNNNVVQNLDFPDSEPRGISFCKFLYGTETNWKQTSYNRSFRKNFAGIGSFYLTEKDVFTTPRPYPSWTLNENDDWDPPIPHPNDGLEYYWDEENVQWVLIQ